MTDPNTLPPYQLKCPSDCPFLAGRHFMPDVLPYYCNKFEEFLGAVADTPILRTLQCRLMPEDIVTHGLNLIDAYTLTHLSIPDTKQAFLAMPAPMQQMFVEVVKKTGRQIGIAYGTPMSPDVLMSETLKAFRQAKEWAGSPELKEFKNILGDLTGFAPDLLTRETQNLLTNLFQVLDNSERAMLKGLLSNQSSAEAFLEQFKSIPKDMSLLKNFRHALYEHDDKEKQRRLEQERRLQMERINRAKQSAGRGSR